MEIVFGLIAVFVSAAIGYWVYKADKKRGVPYPLLTSFLRSLVMFLTLLLLVAPLFHTEETQEQQPTIVFLQDNSQSIATALSGDSTTYKKNAQALLQKLSQKYRVVQWGFGSEVQKDTLFRYQQPATNISHALSEAIDYYGEQNLGAVILATDGRFNEGSSPLFQELSFDGSIYTVAIGDTSIQKDIKIEKVYANKTAVLNNQFEIKADVLATACEGYQQSVHLKTGNGNLLQSIPISIASSQFDKGISFTVTASQPGLQHYIIEVPAAIGEKNTGNNRKDVFIEVVNEKKNILLIAAAPHPDIHAIQAAMKGQQQFTLTVRDAANIPTDWGSYQAIIFHSLPKPTLPIPAAAWQKPVWLIIGQGTQLEPLKTLSIAALNVNTMNLQNHTAQWNESFNSFTMPTNTVAVMDKMPPLACPAGTIKAGVNSISLFTSKQNGQPLWLLQASEKPTALLAGEGLWRWRMYEYRYFSSHQVIDEAIRQTLSFLTANTSEKPFRLQLSKYIWNDREPIVLDAFLRNAGNEQVNTAAAQLTLTDSNGKKEIFTFNKQGNAYQLNIGTRASGNYQATAAVNYNGKTYTDNVRLVVQNLPIESLETGADYPLLYNLAHPHSGSVVMAASVESLYDSIRQNTRIAPILKQTEKTIPLIDWKWYFAIVLLIATVEWLLRKYWMAQ